MSTPVNKDLRELRMAKEHYINILKNDEKLKKENNPENNILLTEKDIAKINSKIEGISEKIDELLLVEKDYKEVI